jgi:hypothetical protein
VNFISDLCCALHEWLVFVLRDGTEIYTPAAFFRAANARSRKIALAD